MKLVLTIPGKRLSVEMDDAAAEQRFAGFVGQLFRAAPPVPVVTETRAPREKAAYYLECPHCGKRRAFTWGGLLRWNHCPSCHMKLEIDAEQLAKIDFLCKSCGTQETYLTNITDAEFEMPCYVCHSPVKIAYDDALERFEVVET